LLTQYALDVNLWHDFDTISPSSERHWPTGMVGGSNAADHYLRVY